MWDFDAQLNGTSWEIGDVFKQDIMTRTDAIESAQAWLESLSASERQTATISIREYNDDTGAAKGLGEEIKETTE